MVARILTDDNLLCETIRYDNGKGPKVGFSMTQLIYTSDLTILLFMSFVNASSLLLE